MTDLVSAMPFIRLIKARNGWLVVTPATYSQGGMLFVFPTRKAMTAWLSKQDPDRLAVQAERRATTTSARVRAAIVTQQEK